MRPVKKTLPTDMKGVGPFLNLGFQLAFAVMLGLGLGYLIDSKLKSTPVFLLIGLALGAVAGFLSVYRTVYPRKEDQKKKRL